jgi:hypothetical protein
MSSKIQGIVTYIANTKGIKLEGSDIWFNPKGQAINMIVPEIKSSKVELTIFDEAKHLFSDIKILEKSNPEPKQITKEDYWARKEQRDIIREAKLSNGAALNTAIEILKFSEDRPESSNDILDLAVELSKKIKKVIEE